MSSWDFLYYKIYTTWNMSTDADKLYATFYILKKGSFKCVQSIKINNLFCNSRMNINKTSNIKLHLWRKSQDKNQIYIIIPQYFSSPVCTVPFANNTNCWLGGYHDSSLHKEFVVCLLGSLCAFLLCAFFNQLTYKWPWLPFNHKETSTYTEL